MDNDDNTCSPCARFIEGIKGLSMSQDTSGCRKCKRWQLRQVMGSIGHAGASSHRSAAVLIWSIRLGSEYRFPVVQCQRQRLCDRKLHLIATERFSSLGSH